jgi:uncharacterized protein
VEEEAVFLGCVVVVERTGEVGRRETAPILLAALWVGNRGSVRRFLIEVAITHRLNVAISRAQCLAYLVCSPQLLEVDCKTIPHMRLANALCRFVELASRPR